MIGDQDFKDLMEGIAQAIDLAGAGIIVLGLVLATLAYARAARPGTATTTAFRDYRRNVGKAILLGLEFLVAADIVRTVAIEPSFRGVGVLAAIVAVRTLLSFSLETELEGRPPWRRAAAERAEAHERS